MHDKRERELESSASEGSQIKKMAGQGMRRNEGIITKRAEKLCRQRTLHFSVCLQLTGDGDLLK